VTLLLETDLPPRVALPAAAMLAGLCLWYWRRLGREGVPESRRRIRRFSLLLILITLPGLVWCSSLVDHRVDPRGYVVGWLCCLMLLAMIVLTAVADVLDTMRLRSAEVEPPESMR